MMPLMPYEPFRYLDQFRREFDRFFSDLPENVSAMGERFGGPRVDVHETEDAVIVTCDIPGLEKKEDVKIEIEPNLLMLSGTIQHTRDTKQEQMHRQERMVGHFKRTVSLPTRVSSEGVKATYRNGVLDIHMPKIMNEQRKAIDIEFH